MRKSDTWPLIALVCLGVLLGVVLMPADVTVRNALAFTIIGGAIGLLLGSLAVCARIYVKDRKP